MSEPPGGVNVPPVPPGRQQWHIHAGGGGEAGVSDDPFEALGLPARADLSDEDVRAAWQRIAAATHPDRDDGGDPARFGAAAAAYDTLRTSFGRGEALADLGLAGAAPAPAHRAARGSARAAARRTRAPGASARARAGGGSATARRRRRRRVTAAALLAVGLDAGHRRPARRGAHLGGGDQPARPARGAADRVQGSGPGQDAGYKVPLWGQKYPASC